jgi:hypothetical protein
MFARKLMVIEVVKGSVMLMTNVEHGDGGVI